MVSIRPRMTRCPFPSRRTDSMHARTCLHAVQGMLTAALLAMAAAAGASGSEDGPKIAGWVETARIRPGNMQIIAKLDTGSLSSSINAKNITEFDRDGERWVRFTVVNRAGRSQKLELPVLRDVVIKEHGGQREERPVVMLGICIGSHYAETQVSLVDRGGFLYPLLIGRRYLKRQFLIDASKKYTLEPRCNGEQGE